MSDNDQYEKQLKQALERLEETAQKIVQTHGYTRDARAVKLLEEMIREQLNGGANGHSRNPTRQIR